MVGWGLTPHVFLILHSIFLRFDVGRWTLSVECWTFNSFFTLFTLFTRLLIHSFTHLSREFFEKTSNLFRLDESLFFVAQFNAFHNQRPAGKASLPETGK